MCSDLVLTKCTKKCYALTDLTKCFFTFFCHGPYNLLAKAANKPAGFHVPICMYNFNDIHFSYPLDVVRRRMQLAGAVTDGYKYRCCLLAFFQFVHSVLSLKAGARGFPRACKGINRGYFRRKKQEKRPSRSVPCLLVAYLWQLEILGKVLFNFIW